MCIELFKCRPEECCSGTVLLALCIASACSAVFAQQLRTRMFDMTGCYSGSQLDSTPSADPQQQLPQQLQGRLSGLQPPALLPFLRSADDSTPLACMHDYYSASSPLSPCTFSCEH